MGRGWVVHPMEQLFPMYILVPDLLATTSLVVARTGATQHGQG
ncbi:hypothetical protein [Pasteuria penetrans]|nr:hypothetical protein [Pasteuria penetrans]